MVNKEKHPHKYETEDQTWKCFKSVCLELGISTNKAINDLINEFLIKHEDLALKFNKNQRLAIEKRKKK